MKRIVSYILLIVCVFSFYSIVEADEYKVNDLIPVDSMASVKTEKFDYNEFIYKSNLDAKGNSVIDFNSIKNNTNNKNAVSINVLLFGSDKKNIGFLTYCSDKDIDGNYAGFKLKGNESAPFSITVSSKYFIDGKSAKDVKFVAIMDDNKYCQVGGYDKYKDLTIEEIINGDIQKEKDKDLAFSLQFFENSPYMSTIIMVIVIIVGFLIFGMILNTLHLRMYAKTTIFSYIPVTNLFITVKLAFGTIVAIAFIILDVIAGVLILMDVYLLSYVVGVIFGISFLIVLLKLVTKKYNLFYFEPSIKNEAIDSKSLSKMKKSDELKKEEKDTFDLPSPQELVDISYKDAVVDEEVSSKPKANTDNLFNVSSSEIDGGNDLDLEDEDDSDIGLDDEIGDSEEKEDDSNEGESDLSKFFQ